MKNIIFHHPLPLNPNATSASGIRPLKMLNAFISLGYEVDIVAGYSSERKKAIKKIKKKIMSGVKYEFVYSESSTMPTILTDRHHLPLNPLLDFMFFRFCKSNDIKTGLFYRDIYWIFDSYGRDLKFFKKLVANLSYRYELYFYKKYLAKLYLPSVEMGRYVPIVQSEIFSALPPGHDIDSVSDLEKKTASVKRNLKIFYVGGVSELYQMHILFTVVNKRSDIDLTICTRATEWEAVKGEYPALSERIKVVHKNGAEMQALMADSDIVSIFVKPHEYREFAAPVKLYEYLGYRKPILATQGTLAGEFVAKNQIGWSLPYTEGELDNFLARLVEHPELIDEVRHEMDSVALIHSWKARAQQVAKDLS